MTAVSDTDLWNELREGKKSALKSIYDKHYRYLINYGRKIFKDQTIVEDNIHDLFVDLWQKHKSIGPTDHIGRYLAASLRRKIIAAKKKQEKVVSVESFDNDDFDAELSIEEVIVQGEMNKEKAKKLKVAFEKLSSRQKEIIYLRFYQNMEYEEIAETVGIKNQSLRNLISGGMKKMRTAITILILMTLFL